MGLSPQPPLLDPPNLLKNSTYMKSINMKWSVGERNEANTRFEWADTIFRINRFLLTHDEDACICKAGAKSFFQIFNQTQWARVFQGKNLGLRWR